MKTLSDKINESLKESYTQADENLDSIIDIIDMLCVDYFSDDTNAFEIETTHIGNTIHRKIIFQNQGNALDSFKEAVVSAIGDFNNKMKSMGQNEISATWKQDNQTNILELC